MPERAGQQTKCAALALGFAAVARWCRDDIDSNLKQNKCSGVIIGIWIDSKG